MTLSGNLLLRLEMPNASIKFTTLRAFPFLKYVLHNVCNAHYHEYPPKHFPFDVNSRKLPDS